MFANRMINFNRFGWNNPFAEMERMSRRMDALFNRLAGGTPFRLGSGAGVFPAVNLTEDADRYHLRAELPGMKAGDLDIQVTGNSLSIKGERKIADEGDNVRYHRRERGVGRFSRIIGLPGDIEPEKVEARMENGVLTVSIAKPEASKPRQITVS